GRRDCTQSGRVMRIRPFAAALALAVCVLAPAAAAAQVRGGVSDATSGEPVSGALVWLAGRTLRMTHTDDAGAYAFDDVAAGSYCIRVETPGYDEARVCITVSAGASLVVDLPLTMRPLTIDPLVVQ